MLEFYSDDINYDYYQEVKKSTPVFNNIKSIIRKNKIIERTNGNSLSGKCNIRYICVYMYIHTDGHLHKHNIYTYTYI